MATVLLDTTVVIDLLRGREAVAARLRDLRRRGDSPSVCAITVEETFRGLRPAERQRAEAIFEGLWIVPLAASEGRRAGEWRQAYASRGRTLAQADCLIAAAAVTAGGRMATGNSKDFPMPEVTVEHWPAGE